MQLCLGCRCHFVLSGHNLVDIFVIDDSLRWLPALWLDTYAAQPFSLQCWTDAIIWQTWVPAWVYLAVDDAGACTLVLSLFLSAFAALARTGAFELQIFD